MHIDPRSPSKRKAPAPIIAHCGLARGARARRRAPRERSTDAACRARALLSAQLRRAPPRLLGAGGGWERSGGRLSAGARGGGSPVSGAKSGGPALGALSPLLHIGAQASEADEIHCRGRHLPSECERLMRQSRNGIPSALPSLPDVKPRPGGPRSASNGLSGCATSRRKSLGRTLSNTSPMHVSGRVYPSYCEHI